MKPLFFALLTIGAFTGTAGADQQFVVEVGTVGITATRPGTNRPWDTIEEAKKGDICNLLGLVGAAGPGAAEVCRLLQNNQDRRTRVDPSMPDVFVRAKSSGPRQVTYRTETVPNVFIHTFGARFVFSIEAITGSGITVQVVDDDSSPSTDNLIGELLLTRSRLLELAQAGEPLTVKDGGIDKMVLTVTLASAENPKLIRMGEASCSTIDRRGAYAILGGTAVPQMTDEQIAASLNTLVDRALRQAEYAVVASAPNPFVATIICNRERLDSGSSLQASLVIGGPDGPRTTVTAASSGPIEVADFETTAPSVLVRKLAQQGFRP